MRNLFDGKVPSRLTDEVLGWLVSRENNPGFEKPLAELFDSEVRKEEPDENTFRSLQEIMLRIGGPVQVRAKKSMPLSRKIWIATASAAAIAVLVFAGQFWFGGGVPDVAIENGIAVVTQNDAQKHIFLSDGSEVWLKEGSEITYEGDFNSNRTVVLSGGAFFSVAKIPEKPFRVKTTSILATVTGTEFDIQDYGSEQKAKITLISGSVNVDAGKKTYALTPAQQLTVDKQKKDIKLETVDLDVMSDWRKPVVFDHADLGSVLDYMGNRYNVKFVVEGSLPTQKNITIEFGNDETVDEVLYVLSGVSGFRYDNDTGTITIRLNE